MIEENKELREKMQSQSHQNGVSQSNIDDDLASSNVSIGGDKSPRTHTTKKLFGLKTAGNAAKFVAKLSPKNLPISKKQRITLLKIYNNELENQPEFEHFKEWLHTFELYRGKKTGDEIEDESRIVGAFKGALKVYKWPLPKDLIDHTIMGFDPQYGFFQGNFPLHL